jgi:hypothetical protein
VSRRAIERVGLLVGLATLLLVLASATLLDRRPPSVANISLSRTAGDQRVALTHSTIDVEFSEPVRRPGAENRFRITPSVDGSLSWADERTLVFTPREKLPVATEFTVHMENGYEDSTGNDATDPSQPLIFRTVDLPVVTQSEPADGTADLALEGSISITFDRLMDTNLTVAALEVEPEAALDTTWRGTTLIVTPREPLRPGTPYTLTVGAGAADIDGNALARPYTASFTTVATGLGVQIVLPADGTAGAPVDGSIAVVFDGAVDPDGVAGAFRLTPSVGGATRVIPMPADSTDGPTDATILQFDPTDRLAPHTTYTVELRPGVVRADGAATVAEGRTWSFTTGAPPELLQNQIVFLAARGGVRNVWAMNPDGTNARQLTSELAPVTSYELDLDGRSLLFATAGVVRRLSLPDGQVRTLTAAADAEYGPRLVPDGRSMLVWRRTLATDVDRGLWLVPVDGSGAGRQLVPAGAPPLGSSLVTDEAPDVASETYRWLARTAVSGDGTTALAISAAGDALEVPLLPEGPAEGTGLSKVHGPPVWSSRAAGFIVAAQGPSDTRRAAWLVRPGMSPERLTDIGAWPEVGGGALVGLSPADPPRLEYRVALRTSGNVLTNAEDLLDRQPSFAPDGRSILFARVPRETPTRSAGIWLVGTDGLELRQLAPDGSDPRWLP